MGCTQCTCCDDEFRIVVIGSAASGVSTTVHAIISYVNERHDFEAERRNRKTRSLLSSTDEYHPPLVKNTDQQKNSSPNEKLLRVNRTNNNSKNATLPKISASPSSPDEYQEPQTPKKIHHHHHPHHQHLLITPSVALRVLPSVPFSCCFRKAHVAVPKSLVIVDAGPANHPAYRESVQLAQQLSHCNGVIVVIDGTKSLAAQKIHRVMELVAAGIKPATPVFILVNKYDVERDDLIVPQDILQARFPLLVSSKCRTPWRCLPGAASDSMFDPAHILEFLVDPTGIDHNANVVLMKPGEADDDDAVSDGDNGKNQHQQNDKKKSKHRPRREATDDENGHDDEDGDDAGEESKMIVVPAATSSANLTTNEQPEQQRRRTENSTSSSTSTTAQQHQQNYNEDEQQETQLQQHRADSPPVLSLATGVAAAATAVVQKLTNCNTLGGAVHHADPEAEESLLSKPRQDDENGDTHHMD